MFIAKLRTATLLLLAAGLLAAAGWHASAGPDAPPAPGRPGAPGGPPGGAPVPNEGDPLIQGVWAVETADFGGFPAPDYAKGTRNWVIRGGTLAVGPREGGHTATYRVDRTRTPGRIDLTFASGDDAGKELAGIYKLEGGRLIVYYSCIDKGRPPEWFEEDAFGGARFVLTRARPPVAWGEPVAGLRAGLALADDGGPYRVGRTVSFAFTLENVGDQEVTLTYFEPTFHRGGSPAVADARGRPAPVTYPAVNVPVRPVRVALPPGKTLELVGPRLDLRPADWAGGYDNATLHAAPGTYRVTQKYPILSGNSVAL